MVVQVRVDRSQVLFLLCGMECQVALPNVPHSTKVASRKLAFHTLFG